MSTAADVLVYAPPLAGGLVLRLATPYDTVLPTRRQVIDQAGKSGLDRS